MEKMDDKMILAEDGNLNYNILRMVCLECGADDVGFIDINREGIQSQREKIMNLFPQTQTLITLAVFLNPENAISPARNLTSFDVHLAEDILGISSRKIIMKLRKYGVKGVYLPPVFPMDTSRPGPEALNLSLKPIAEESGLGLMGLNRLVLHPEAGSAVWFATILIDKALDRYDKKLSRNSCIDCKLCVAACPVGAIKDNGEFDWLPCMIHNYREVVINFVDWVDALVTSPDMDTYRKRFSNLETVSWWQSLAYRPTYQCNHCVGVCPAAESMRSEYEADKKAYFNSVVRPLIERPQTVYVIKGSKAEEKAKLNKNKVVKTVNPPSK